MKRARRRHGRAFGLPDGQHTFTIRVGGGGRHAGEYPGEKGLVDTVRKAREEFLPHLDRFETLSVVHFDRDGIYTFTDKVLKR